MVQARFEVGIVVGDDLMELDEAELASRPDHGRAALGELEALEGALIIEVPGQPVIRVDDDLSAAVQHLCLACAPALLSEQPKSYVYRYTTTDGHVVMIPLGNLVRLVGEHIPTATAATHTLLPALFACGLRYLQLLDRIGGEHARWSAERLRPLADDARASLRQHGLL